MRRRSPLRLSVSLCLCASVVALLAPMAFGAELRERRDSLPTRARGVQGGATQYPPPHEEARISLDLKEADVVDVVRMLAELAGFQVVLHPGISCKLTLKLSEVPWTRVLDVALRSCNLGRDEDEGVLRVAPTAQLVAEAEARRKLEEARAEAAPRSVTRFGLSYARAREMAPVLKKMLGPRAEVVWDERTNTLIIID